MLTGSPFLFSRRFSLVCFFTARDRCLSALTENLAQASRVRAHPVLNQLSGGFICIVLHHTRVAVAFASWKFLLPAAKKK